RGRNWAQVKKGPVKKTPVKAVAKSRKAPRTEKEALVDLQNQVFAILPFTPIISAPNSGEGDAQPSPAHLANSNWMIASTWNGLFITDDEKRGWREIKFSKGANSGVPIKISAVVTNSKLPGAIFVGTNEGLFVSRDNGGSFQQMPLPEPARRIH